MTLTASAGPSTENGKRARDGAHEDEFTYNPRQDANDRRKVRSDYRALIAQAEESKKDSSLKPQDLLALIQRADTLHGRVVAPSESILDTRTLSSVSEMGARMAKKMKLNTDAFDTNEFVTRLARYLGGEAVPARVAGATIGSDDEDDDHGAKGRRGGVHSWNWDKLATLAAGYSRRAVTIDFLLGPLEIVIKQRKAHVQRRVEEHAERSAPKQLRQQDLQNNAESDTAAQVHKVARLLTQQGEGGVNLFKFVADPDSFTNTIENLFHVSFLIREGKAGISTDDQGNAILTGTNPPGDEDYDEGVQKKQFVMELDYATYLEILELYEVDKSIIPTRTNKMPALSGRQALAAARASNGADAPAPSSQSSRRG